MFAKMSIRNKLAFILWGFALAAYALAGVGLALFQNITLERRAGQAMEPYARFVSVGADAAVAFEDPVRAKEILNTLRANPQIVEAAIVLEDGRLLSGFGNQTDTAFLSKPNGIHLRDGTAELLQPLKHGARLHMTMKLEQLWEDTRRILWVFGVGAIVLLAITVSQLAILQRAIITPITTLAAAAESVRTRADYDQQVPAEGDDEVAMLGRSFNAMMETIRIRDRDLRQLARFQRTLVDSAPYGIISCDPEGIVTSFNRAAERLLGYGTDEVVGRQSPILWHDSEEIMQRARQLSEELGEPVAAGFGVFTTLADRGLPDENEWTFIRKDGTRVPVLLSVSALKDENGKFTGFVGLAYDLTERKKLEEQLRQAQKMEAVGQLAGGVAHDFNNMLGVIIGYAELILAKKALDDPLRQYIEEILRAGHHSEEITRQLLAFARKQTVVPKILDLNKAVDGTLKLLRRLIGEDIDLAWLPGGELWPLKMDPSQVDQILVNLCVNAKDAIAGVGKITIETSNVKFDDAYCAEHRGFSLGEYIMLAVSDDGSGMDKPTMDRIFEPFFTTKGVSKGTGLGLATVYGIVRQNDGFINVHSEPGHGSTFEVFLPRPTATAVQEPKESKEPQDLRGQETILVVEDEASHLEISKLILETYGYQVLTASTPGEALLVAQTHTGRIHLLLTDLIMPEMNGRELAEEIISICPDILCLFMSGYPGNVIVHQGIIDEGIHFIQKPFSKQCLANKVREILDG